MKNKKKGFTLVELLVVIAILAILATVSILGYTSFTEKAKISVAEQELAQVRTQLLADWLDGYVGDAKKGNDYIKADTNGYTITTGETVTGHTKATLLGAVDSASGDTLKFYTSEKEAVGATGTIKYVEFKASNGYYAVWDVKENSITGSKTSFIPVP